MELQDAKDRLTLSVILAYLQILSSQDQLSVSVKQAELSRKQVERLEVLHREGAIAPALLYDLQGQLGNDELAIINNRNAVALAKLDLSELMNVPFNNELQVESMTHAELVEYPVGTPDEIYRNAVNQLSVIKATAFHVKSAGKAVKAVRGGFFPTVSLSGNIYTNYSSAATRDVFLNTIETPSDDFVQLSGTKLPVVKKESRFNSERISYFSQFNNNYSSSVSVGVRIPILNAFSTKNELSLARIQLKQAEYIEETSKIELRRQIEQAYLNMTSALERYKILLNQVTSYTQSFRAAESRFNAGASTQVDYLIAKNNLDKTHINLILSRYDYILRLKILDYYQGRLVF
jgi:outer membrane protein